MKSLFDINDFVKNLSCEELEVLQKRKSSAAEKIIEQKHLKDCSRYE